MVECPKLAAPTDRVIDALETTLDDPQSAAWVDQLDRHLEKLDRC